MMALEKPAEVRQLRQQPQRRHRLRHPVQGDAAGAPKEESSALAWLIESLGWPYAITFLAISFVFISLLVMSILASRRENFVPQELVDSFETKLNEKDFQGAYDIASADESILGRILSAGLSKLSRGYSKALEGMQEVGEDETMKAEHRLSYIALIGSVSPMVGLLGTVDGMIRSFQVIVQSGATPKASDLAKGISTALLTTLVGLLLAIPALTVYHILRNRITRLFLEVGIASENLMNRFEDIQPKGGVKKTP